MATTKIAPLDKYKALMDKIKNDYADKEHIKKNGYPGIKWVPEKEDPYADKEPAEWNYKWGYKEAPTKKPTILPKNKKKATPKPTRPAPKPTRPAPKPKPAADILDF